MGGINHHNMGGLFLLHSHYSILSDFDMLKAQQNPLWMPMVFIPVDRQKNTKPMGVACAAGDASAGAATSGAAVAFSCGNSWCFSMGKIEEKSWYD